MSELSDLDINLKIAEIENWEWKGKGISSLGSILTLDLSDEFNPLTDNALCFELMIKHRIWLSYGEDGFEDKFFTGIESRDGYITYDKNPNKAICLAIIEANK